MSADLQVEFDAEYAQGVEHAGQIIWQSIAQGPGAAPDWDLFEWRMGHYEWRRKVYGVDDFEFEPYARKKNPPLSPDFAGRTGGADRVTP